MRLGSWSRGKNQGESGGSCGRGVRTARTRGAGYVTIPFFADLFGGVWMSMAPARKLQVRGLSWRTNCSKSHKDLRRLRQTIYVSAGMGRRGFRGQQLTSSNQKKHGMTSRYSVVMHRANSQAPLTLWPGQDNYHLQVSVHPRIRAYHRSFSHQS
jgi:hypothetical protein